MGVLRATGEYNHYIVRGEDKLQEFVLVTVSYDAIQRAGPLQVGEGPLQSGMEVATNVVLCPILPNIAGSCKDYRNLPLSQHLRGVANGADGGH